MRNTNPSKATGTAILALFAGMVLFSSAQASAQATRGGPIKPTPTYPDDEIASLYNAIPSDPVISAAIVSDAEMATVSARSPENRAVAAQVRNDPCAEEEMREICNYAGADTIRKIRTLNWVTATAAGGAANRVDGGEAWKYRLSAKFGWDLKKNKTPRMAGGGLGGEEERIELSRQVLEYGIRQNLERHYGQKGASDEQEASLNGASASAAKLAKVDWSITTRSGFGCGQDEKDIDFGIGSSVFFSKHRLTTCRAYFSKRLVFWVWSFEGAFELSHSRFARKVLLWIPTGAESVMANSVLAGSGNPKLNNNKYYSPLSVKFKFVTNGAPMSINAFGAASSLATGFNVSM